MGVSSLVIMTPPSSSLQFLNLTISSFPLSESRPPCNFTTFTHNLTTTFTYIYQPPYKFLIPLNPSIAYFPFDILEGKETRTGFKTGKMSIRGTPSKRNTSSISFYKRKARSKRYRIQVHMLNRRKRSEENIGDYMKEKNLKLYMENITIFHENEKLRMKASLLHQENLSLMSEVQKKKLSHLHHCVSSTLDSSTSSSPKQSP